MPKRLEVYKCPICGNIVEVVHSGAGALICCGKNMDRMTENTTFFTHFFNYKLFILP